LRWIHVIRGQMTSAPRLSHGALFLLSRTRSFRNHSLLANRTAKSKQLSNATQYELRVDGRL